MINSNIEHAKYQNKQLDIRECKFTVIFTSKETSGHVIALVLRSGAAAARASWRRPSRTRVKLVSWRHGLPGEITKPAGRRNRLRQQAAQRSGGRAAARPRRATGVSHTVGGVTTLNGAGRCAGAGTRARGERRYGARAQVLWAQQPPHAGAAAPAPPRTARAALSHAPKRRIYLPCLLALLLEDVAQGGYLRELHFEFYIGTITDLGNKSKNTYYQNFDETFFLPVVINCNRRVDAAPRLWTHRLGLGTPPRLDGSRLASDTATSVTAVTKSETYNIMIA